MLGTRNLSSISLAKLLGIRQLVEDVGVLREVVVSWTTAAEAALRAQGPTEVPPAPDMHVRVAWAERVALDVDTGAYQAAVARAVAARDRAAAARSMPFGAMNVVVYDPPWGPDASESARFRELDAALLQVRFLFHFAFVRLLLTRPIAQDALAGQAFTNVAMVVVPDLQRVVGLEMAGFLLSATLQKLVSTLECVTLASFADAAGATVAERVAACIVNRQLRTLLPSTPAAVGMVQLLSSGAELDRARTAYFARREAKEVRPAAARRAAAAADSYAAADDDGIVVSFFASASEAAEAAEDETLPVPASTMAEDDALAFLRQKIGEHGHVRRFVSLVFSAFC